MISKKLNVKNFRGWRPSRTVLRLVSLTLLAIVGIVYVSIFTKPGVNFIDDSGEHAVPVRIINDTTETLTVKQCKDSKCEQYAENELLKPGEGHLTNGANDDVKQPWEIFNQSSERTGCLNLQFLGQDIHNEQTVVLSKASACK